MQLKTIVFLLTIFLTIALFFMGILGEFTLKMNGEKFWGTAVESLTCWSLTWLGIFLGRQSKDLSPGG